MPPSVAGAVVGPVLIAIVWIGAGQRLDLRRLEAVDAFVDRLGWTPRTTLVLTNKTGVTLAGPGQVVVLGPSEIAALLDRQPRAYRSTPSLLGIRDLSDVLDAGAADRSVWDEVAARALAQVFVGTHAYRAALAVLERHRFVVLTGPPEMGKTAIARTLGLALQSEGWEVHECIRPEQVAAAFAADRPQLFIADDAFGSTEYRPDAAERWAVELDRIIRGLDERHWLVWTSRPAPLKAGLARVHREHGVERFPRPAEIQVDAAALDLEEKALILYRHARAAGLQEPAIRLVQTHGAEIVEHEHFTPERIKRFVATRLAPLAEATSRLAELAGVPPSQTVLALEIDAEIAEPTAAMAASFAALSPEHRLLLVALVDQPPGPVPERELATAARRHARDGFPRPPSVLVDRITDHFIRLVPPTSVTWVHPSWRDLVIDHIASDSDDREAFLRACSLDGLLLALSRGGGSSGERSQPLLVTDHDWDRAVERLYELVPDLVDGDLSRLLSALADALGTTPDHPELQALATATLDRIASCWERPDIYASRSVLRQWRALASTLKEQPRIPRVRRFWEDSPHHQPERRDDHSLWFEAFPDDLSRPAPDDGRRENTRSIVKRILADL